jgi:uncharacterized protein YutE (UPF0331/DUF86 family)
MLNRNLVKTKIFLITQDLERLKSFGVETFDEVAKDAMKYAAVQNLLMKIIGRAIDINEHIISKTAGLEKGLHLKYRETFLELEGLGVLPKKFAQEISKSAGLRNALVHDYDNLEDYIVYKSVGDAISQYTKYCDYILKYLKKK